MVSFTTILIAGMILISFASIGFALYEIFYKPKRKPADYTICRNSYMSHYTTSKYGNHAELKIISSIKGTSGRIGLKWLPTDIPNLEFYNYKRRRYEIPNFEPRIFWVPKNKIISSAKHTGASSSKEIIDILPFSKSDINPQILDASFGKVALALCTETNINSINSEFENKEIQNYRALILSNAVGEVTPDLLEKTEKMADQKHEIISKERDKKQGFTGFPLGGQPH